MGTQLTGILQIAIPAADIARTTAFYRDVLELRFLMDGPNMAFFDCGGVRLYWPQARAPASPAPVLTSTFAPQTSSSSSRRCSRET